MQVLYASSATQMHVRFTQNLAVNKYKQRLSFERRCKITAFYWDRLGNLSQFCPNCILFLILGLL